MTQSIDFRRRGILRASGATVLSASAVALLAGCEKMAVAQTSNAAGDVGILNTALALEYEAISAYQLGAMSGLLQKPVLEIAVMFQTHHKEHRDALIATIRKLGGAPVAAKSDAEVGQALNAASLKSQADVLRLAQRLEKGAANAYIGVIPSFGDRALAQVSARLAADEVMHWTVLSQALKDPLPAKALSFGA
ncbi:ferritin-like domain-containing protein [Reyranella sp.]|uniref:ferritin-like domain-containing protein n=1 Tax=Reyranella sp. TaxID=1929291 RepID=UPI0025DB7CBE|nr:ferritin-like domain-containing protein [Reyranella sp.]